MCGRFVVDDGVWEAAERLTGWLDRRPLQNGDVFPSAQILILKRKAGMRDGARGEEKEGQAADGALWDALAAPALTGCMARWGYPGPRKGRALINARAETVQEKPSFRADFAKRRCVIPAKGFYEWNAGREKFYFSLDAPVLYLAGIYSNDPGAECVTILTVQANESMEPVHDRMPLLIPEGKIADWIAGTDWAARFLREKPPVLKREKVHEEYEQLSLF